MADQCQSLPASETPKIETPAPMSTKTGVKLESARPKFSWDRLLDLDSKAMKRNVSPILKAKKNWEDWSPELRRNVIEEEIETALKKRECSNHTTTARNEYPERWKEECESIVQKWISALAFSKMREVRSLENFHAEDRDDEAADLPEKGVKTEQEAETVQYAEIGKSIAGKRRITGFYREESKEESPLSDAPSSMDEDDDDSSDGQSQEEDESDEDDMPKESRKKRKLSEFTTCTRGLAIIHGSFGFKEKKARVSTTENLRTELSFVQNGMEGGSGPPGGAMQRSWKWVDGKLVEWPPLESEADKNLV